MVEILFAPKHQKAYEDGVVPSEVE
jgi:hypothetical protein